MAHGVDKLNVAWARKHFPDSMTWDAIIQAVELEAVSIFVSEDDHDSSGWATNYFATVRNLAHAGDCGECRAWMRAPITCDACVYDEYMAKAWEALRVKTSIQPVT